MTTQIIAGSMARARIVADDHGIPRSAWVYVRHGSDLMPGRDTVVDRTWSAHPHADGIQDALYDLIASLQPPALRDGYDRWRAEYRYTDITERIPSMTITTTMARDVIVAALAPYMDGDARLRDVQNAAMSAAATILEQTIDVDDLQIDSWYRDQRVMLADGSGEGMVSEVMQTDGEVHTIRVRWADGSLMSYSPASLVAVPPEVSE